MRLRAKVAALAGVVMLVALAAGCGGSSGGGGSSSNTGYTKSSSPGVAGTGASVLPASTPAFLALSTDFTGDQWKQVQALGAKFPGYDKLLEQGRSQLSQEGLDFEKDLVPALGPEVDFAFLDFDNKGDDFVAVTKPDDPAKLDAVVKKSKNPPVTTTIDGYVLLAQTQALLDKATAAKDKLADDAGFKDAMSSLPGGDIVRLFLNGPAVQDAVTKAVKSSSTGSSLPFQLPAGTTTLDWVAASGTAQSDGVRFDGAVKIEPAPKIDAFSAALPKEFAAGAIVYADFANLDQPVKTFYDALSKSSPTLGKQLGQLEGVSGLSLENDVIPLLKNEGAVGVYSSGGKTPTIVFALKVTDEAKVNKLLDQIGSLAGLAGGGSAPTSITVPGYSNAKQLKLGTTSLFYGVGNGTLVVSNEQAGLSDVNGSGGKLADDANFKAAQDGAKMPDQTTGFVYADLKTGVQAILGAVKSVAGASGASGIAGASGLSPADLQALNSALFYSTTDGDLIRIAGFVGIS